MSAYAQHSDKFFDLVEKGLGWLLMFLMGAMVVDVSWQVLTRFVFVEPSSYTEELARFLLIWIGILGAAYAFRKGSHLGLDLLTHTLEGSAKRSTALAANFLCFAFAASVMVYGGWELVTLTLDLNQTSSALEWKMGYVYTVVPISGVLIALFALDNIFHPDRSGPAAEAPPVDAT